MMRSVFLACVALVLTLLHVTTAYASTYQVGPTRNHTQLEQFEEALAPGDVVEIDGDTTYTGDVWLEAYGTEAAPVIIRGITVNGKRPVISGGDYTLMLKGGHYIVENVEITGGAEVCLFQKAENLVLRNSLVTDCDNHGVLAADWDTGSFLMQRVEVRRSGYDIYKHQVYVATDETTFPGSVFRMEGCWIHDANGGINVKSRAERVELYGNWIEGAQYHELDLVGSQEHPVDMAREDSDVVGNVIVKAPGNEYTIARVGGDGTGDTHGRHRFVNNTIVLADETQYGFRLGGQLESFELHNNVIYGNGPTQLWREEYAGTMEVLGTTNWLSQGITTIDGRVSGMRGSDPDVVNLANGDFQPLSTSPLIDEATSNPASPPGLDVPNAQGVPLFVPFVPDEHDMEDRQIDGALDIGAFEFQNAGQGGSGGSGQGGVGSGGAPGAGSSTSSSGGSDGGNTGSGGENNSSGGYGGTGGEDADNTGGHYLTPCHDRPQIIAKPFELYVMEPPDTRRLPDSDETPAGCNVEFSRKPSNNFEMMLFLGVVIVIVKRRELTECTKKANQCRPCSKQRPGRQTHDQGTHVGLP